MGIFTGPPKATPLSPTDEVVDTYDSWDFELGTVKVYVFKTKDGDYYERGVPHKRDEDLKTNPAE